MKVVSRDRSSKGWFRGWYRGLCRGCYRVRLLKVLSKSMSMTLVYVLNSRFTKPGDRLGIAVAVLMIPDVLLLPQEGSAS